MPADSSTKRNAIILGAISEFAKKGFEKASIDAIALRAKVAKGTIFYHFQTKQALFATVLEEGEKRFVERLQAQLYPGMPCEEQLRAALAVEREFILEYRELFQVLMNELLARRQSLASFESILEEGQKEKLFRTDLSAAALSQAIFWQVAVLALQQSKEDLSAFILAGLIAPAQSKKRG